MKYSNYDGDKMNKDTTQDIVSKFVMDCIKIAIKEKLKKMN